MEQTPARITITIWSIQRTRQYLTYCHLSTGLKIQAENIFFHKSYSASASSSTSLPPSPIQCWTPYTLACHTFRNLTFCLLIIFWLSAYEYTGSCDRRRRTPHVKFPNGHSRNMITNIARSDKHMLLQESNLTVRQLHRALITFYIYFKKRNRLANEGLVNLTGIGLREANSDRPLHAPVYFPTTIRPHPGWVILWAFVGALDISTLRLPWTISLPLIVLCQVYNWKVNGVRLRFLDESSDRNENEIKLRHLDPLKPS